MGRHKKDRPQGLSHIKWEGRPASLRPVDHIGGVGFEGSADIGVADRAGEGESLFIVTLHGLLGIRDATVLLGEGDELGDLGCRHATFLLTSSLEKHHFYICLIINCL